VLENFVHDNVFSSVIRVTGVKPVDEYLKLVDRRNRLTRSFYEEVWDKFEFDGIIGPVQALPQLPHGGCDNFSALAIATILYNVLDMPVGCLPVTRVDAEKDMITEDWTKEGGHGSRILEAGIYYGKKPLYDPADMQGMPVNIQVVGKKWEEEKVLAMMNVVDQALGERGFGPGCWDTYMKTRGSK
jgi:amidase